MEPFARASSIFCVGTAQGYQRLRCRLEPGHLIALFEAGSLPFGPLSARPLGALWGADAAWQGGEDSRVVILGNCEKDTLGLPSGWTAEEIALQR